MSFLVFLNQGLLAIAISPEALRTYQPTIELNFHSSLRRMSPMVVITRHKEISCDKYRLVLVCVVSALAISELIFENIPPL